MEVCRMVRRSSACPITGSILFRLLPLQARLKNYEISRNVDIC